MSGTRSMWKHAFYDDVMPIDLKDPLAVFLGAMREDEVFRITYGDVLKLAGHSCPSVSGAYRLTQKALEALYGDELPVRGEICVRILGQIGNGANGPISQVITFITGAAPETGFSGLANQFVRKNKLIFDQDNEEANAFVFTREDTSQSVKVTFHPERVPQDPRMHDLFIKCISGTANPEQTEKFRELWQIRVKTVLFDEVEGLFTIEKVA